MATKKKVGRPKKKVAADPIDRATQRVSSRITPGEREALDEILECVREEHPFVRVDIDSWIRGIIRQEAQRRGIPIPTKTARRMREPLPRGS